MTIQQAFALAMAHHRAGRLADAEPIYRQILAQDANQPVVLQQLGILAFQTARFEDAVQLLARAVAAAPSAEAWYYLGSALFKSKRPTEAITALQNSLSLNPNSFAANNSLGLALIADQRIHDAITALRRAIEINPTATEPLVNLGNVLRSTARIEESLACFRRATQINNDPLAWDNLLFTLNYAPNAEARQIRDEHERWYQTVIAPRVPAPAPHQSGPSPAHRLRVGFVSADFNRHPVARFLLPLFENLDRSTFELFCYSNVADPDAQTTHFKNAADAWRDIRGLDDRRSAEIVRNDQIDLLIDLSLHGEGNRLGLFKLKPAPVQATWLGYAGTTGLPEIDYRITDQVLGPTDGARFVEKPARLPTCFWCYRPPDFAPNVSPPPSLNNGFVTFGCLNNFAKVNDTVIQAWASIMASVRGARLVIHAPPGSHRDNVLQILAVDPARVRFVQFLPTDQYLHEYAAIDIALDPFPFGGGTTTFDALWMGVPVVTLAGPLPPGRAAATILTHLGKSEWIANDVAAYTRLAIDLAKTPQSLAAERSTLRVRLQQSTLTDQPGFARAMETLLQSIIHAPR